MLKGGLSRRSLAGLSILGAGAVLLFLLGVLIYVNASNLTDSILWTQHTDDVLFQTVAAHDDLFEMQSAVRAYALTGDKIYTGGLDQHRRSLQGGLARLKALVADNPAQLQRLARLTRLVQERVSHLVTFMGLTAVQRKQVALSGAEANALLVPPLSLTGRIESGFATFRDVEQGLLTERQARTVWWAHFLGLLSLAAALGAPLLAAAGIVLLWTEELKSRAAELLAQLAQAQRLSLMGETAAMLAHEVKQPLAAAQNYVAVLRRLEPTEKQADIIQRLGGQVSRADAIIQRLRGFIEERPVQREKVQPEALVADAMLLVGTIDSGIVLDTQIDNHLTALWADPIQIQQVLVNLMRNAIEAMKGRARRELALNVTRGAGGMVQFSLADNGPGIPAEVARRLFEPGKSTKEGGMGIGLSICRRIIDAHGGKIWAEDNQEGGARFCFTLPLASGPARPVSLKAARSLTSGALAQASVPSATAPPAP
jgi:signal transduction histidine kinase